MKIPKAKNVTVIITIYNCYFVSFILLIIMLICGNISEGQSKSNSRMSPLLNAQVSAGDGNIDDRQFAVLISEKQARVVALPSQNCVYRQQLSETHVAIKAEITTIKGNN